MARMLGDLHPSWCGTCSGPSGPDCWDKGKDTRAAKAAEREDVRREIGEYLIERAETS